MYVKNVFLHGIYHVDSTFRLDRIRQVGFVNLETQIHQDNMSYSQANNRYKLQQVPKKSLNLKLLYTPRSQTNIRI